MTTLAEALAKARAVADVVGPEVVGEIVEVELALDAISADHGHKTAWVNAEAATLSARTAAAVARHYASQATTFMEGLSQTLISGRGLSLTVIGRGTLLTSVSGGQIIDGSGAPLHGSTKENSFQIEYIPISETPDRVDWYIDGVLYRNDDINPPYELRYGNEPLPIASDFQGVTEFPDGSYPTFNLAYGGTYTIAAHDIRGATQTVTSAQVTVPNLPENPPPPPPGGLWTIPFVNGVQPSVKVNLPQGTLGARTSVSVNPATVTGISKSDNVWVMNRDWDETIHGGWLNFGASRLMPNGHKVLGFKLEVPSGMGSNHVVRDTQDRGSEIGYFEITNPGGHSYNSVFNGAIRVHHYVVRRVNGDCLKQGNVPGLQWHSDGYWEYDPTPTTSSTDKHVDGLQVFQTGRARMDRIVIDWDDCGSYAGTTAALFAHDSGQFYGRHILILNPGGTYEICRFHSSIRPDVEHVQVIGNRAPNVKDPSKNNPRALVNWDTPLPRMTNLFNDVAPATPDFL